MGDPTELVLAAAPTALSLMGPILSSKGKAKATPVPFRNVRRVIRLVFIIRVLGVMSIVSPEEELQRIIYPASRSRKIRL